MLKHPLARAIRYGGIALLILVGLLLPQFESLPSRLIDYSTVLELDLDSIVPSVAGPKRPQDRIELPLLKKEFLASLAGSIFGMLLIARGKGSRRTAIPFGTFLAPAAIALCLYGEPLFRFYRSFLH